MGQSSGAKRQKVRVRMVAQLHGADGSVQDKAQVFGQIEEGAAVTLTVGVQMGPSVMDMPQQGWVGTQQGQGPGLTSVTSDRVSEGQVERPHEQGQGSVQDVAGFLSSPDGIRAYYMWSRGS